MDGAFLEPSSFVCHHCSVSKDGWPKEKNWKLVYTRSEKIARGRQLGFEHQGREEDERAPSQRNVLFVCSRNQWRSPTAEAVWRKHPQLNVRSAGTSPRARKTVSADDIAWADVVFVMEEKHRQRLEAAFPGHLSHKSVHVLGIPDDYKYMDPELVEELLASVGALLGLA